MIDRPQTETNPSIADRPSKMIPLSGLMDRLRRRPMLLKGGLLLIGLAVASLAAIADYVRPTSIQLRSAEGTVLHLRARVLQPLPFIKEMWVVSDTQEVRFEISDLAGVKKSIVARSGVTLTEYSEYSDTMKRISRRVASDQSSTFLNDASPAEFLQYREMLQSPSAPSELILVGQGLSTARYRLAYTIFDHRFETVVLLDKTTLLPLEETTSDVTWLIPVPVRDTGYLFGTKSFQYEVVEYIGRSSLPPRFFEFDSSELSDSQASTVTVDTARYLSIDQAKDFRDFPIYWLGPTFQGLTLTNTTYFHDQDPSSNLPRRLDMIYSTGNRDDPYISIVQTPRGSRDGQWEPDFADTVITITNPALGILSAKLTDQDLSTLMIQVVLTDTVIIAGTRTVTESEELAATLRSLNQPVGNPIVDTEVLPQRPMTHPTLQPARKIRQPIVSLPFVGLNQE